MRYLMHILVGLLLVAMVSYGIWLNWFQPNPAVKRFVHGEQIAYELVIEHLANYQTAVAIGAKVEACQEAKLMLQYAIETHSPKVGQHYMDMKIKACGDE